jgi:hypothetical protein
MLETEIDVGEDITAINALVRILLEDYYTDHGLYSR